MISVLPHEAALSLQTRRSHGLSWLLFAAALSPSMLISPELAAEESPDLDAPAQLDRIEVSGRRQNLLNEAISASQGVVGAEDIAGRPLLRTGDLLEFVPGLVATQHSGSGKANQYFLRGFNLDHGTDFATSVDGMPVNMRTHGHGQGYTDLNFLIPETVSSLTYRKGTWYADVGDFSSAGSAQFALFDKVAAGSTLLSLGEHSYARAALLDSVSGGTVDFLYATEVQTDDGPWRDISEDVNKTNLLLRMSGELGDGRANLSFMGYDNDWNSADQIPTRAVDSGLVSELGSLDTSVGGQSSRYSLSGGWQGLAFGGELSANAYTIDYAMDLWSNFTYLLDDPDNGDQFQQIDDRRIRGFAAQQRWGGERSQWRLGAEGRFDDIDRVALLRTANRQPVSSVRDDVVEVGSLGVYLANEYRLSDQLRSHLGLRHDRYDFDVDSSRSENSGTADDSITTWKAGLAWQASSALELYLSYGTGFHSNDARGITITVDPSSGEPAERVDPLVESRGAELGARYHLNERLQATMALWTLRLDSELLFVGDAGATEATRPSQRDGIELGLYWFAHERYRASLEASWTDARFEDQDPAGREIPGAIPLVLSAGFDAQFGNGWLANAQLRHFGSYPLIEDRSVESDGSTLLNLRLGREWGDWGLYLDLLNALDSRDHDIDYFYASRLPGEPAEGVEDVHYHVFAPRTLRASLRYAF